MTMAAAGVNAVGYCSCDKPTGRTSCPNSTAVGSGSSQREALAGAAERVLDHMFDCSSSEEMAKVLQDSLERAAGEGDKSLVQKLAKAGAQAGDAVHAAVRGGHGEVLTWLLESGADATGRGYTALHLAANLDRPEMARLLLAMGADQNAPGREGDGTPLHMAAKLGHIGVVMALLGAGAGVNRRKISTQMVTNEQTGKSSLFDFRGESPLDAASIGGHVDVMRALMEHGADVRDATGFNRYTALHWAASWNKTGAIDLLVEAGADVEALSSRKRPLQIAAAEGRLEAARALLNNGADINAEDYGWTALHLASRRAGIVRTQQDVSPCTRRCGAVEMVDLLLRHGADETLACCGGKSAADVVGEDAPYDPADVGANDAPFDPSLVEDIERVLKLLDNAPVDRTWRRRGFLALCRAHPTRLQPPPRQGERAFFARRTGAAGVGGGRSVACERANSDWTDAAAWLLGLGDDGMFEKIVGYL